MIEADVGGVALGFVLGAWVTVMLVILGVQESLGWEKRAERKFNRRVRRAAEPYISAGLHPKDALARARREIEREAREILVEVL